jgi:hypothetical protein
MGPAFVEVVFSDGTRFAGGGSMAACDQDDGGNYHHGCWGSSQRDAANFYFFIPLFAARPLAGAWSARHRTAAGSIQ